MAYIHNGRVVEKKPFTLKGFLLAIWSALTLFLQTFFSLQPMNQTVDEHQHSAANRGSSNSGGWRGWLRGLLNRGSGQTLGSGSSRNNGDSGWAAAVNRRGGNIHSLPKPSISGGCAGGG